MTDSLSIKQRVLGTLVLISLAVIFLPMLFSSHDEFFSKQDDFIPAPPDKLKTIIYRLDDDGVFKLDAPEAAMPAPEPAPVTETAVPVAEAVQGAVADTQPAPSAAQAAVKEDSNLTPDLPAGLQRWMAQLGSFGQEENAEALRDKVRELGYPAYVDKRGTGEQSIWRVRVGPYVTEKEAETTLAVLQKKLQLNGLVVRHQ